MAKQDTRARLIAEGAKLIHEKGFNHTGVQEILQASGVPKGSFYFYFQTKEEFGLAVVDYFSQYMGSKMEMHLSDSSLPHIKRLKNFFDEMMEYFRHEGCCRGCPIGNLAQELSDLSDTFREKLKDALAMMEARIVASLQASLEANEVATALDPHEAAYFILNSWEGALTRMKTEKSVEPLVVFDKMIFGFLLRTTGEDDHSRLKNDTDCKK
jgi:TetR/AcrR family transcriptional repressor of nem operon